MGLPFAAGAIHETVACVFAGVAVTEEGIPGTLYTVTEELFAEYVPMPAALRAATRKMCAVLAVNPVAVNEV